MLRDYFLNKVENAIEKAIVANKLGQMTEYTKGTLSVEKPKNPDFGDFAINISSLARSARIAPPMIANSILEFIDKEDSDFSVIGGFINFKAGDSLLVNLIEEVFAKKNNFGKPDKINKEKIILEYISANPTGPFHIGHGRWAAMGSALANLLKFYGHDVYQEFYINDAGSQIQKLGRSLVIRVKQVFGLDVDFPEDEIERKIKEFMKKGWNRKRISGELNMGYEELNPIVDKIIIEWDKEKKRAELFEKNDKKGEKNQSDSNTMPVRNGIVELDKQNSSESQENDGKQADIEITNEKINRMNMLKDMIRDYRINPVIQREYYLLCIQFVKSGRKLKKEELDLLVRAVENGSINIDMDCLRFIGTEYAKLGDITPAIKLSTMCISLYGETESLLQFRKVLLDMQKKQKVLNLIKQNMPVQVIIEKTGESEINVLRMRREYQQANSQEQER